MPNKFYQVKRFTAELGFEQKKATPVLNGDGVIIDYRDVVVEGYLSTFVTKTAQDRIGDYVLPGAFTETLKSFIKNPVSQVDHENRVFSNAGQFIEASEDQNGLKVAVLLTNAPDMIGLRVRVMEKSIRSLSMGGLFFYLEDGYGIYKVDLYEGSFVAIPMNPDCTFTVRSLSLEEYKALSKFAIAENATDQLRQSTIAGRIVASENISEALKLLPLKAWQKSQPIEQTLSVGGLKIAQGAKLK